MFFKMLIAVSVLLLGSSVSRAEVSTSADTSEISSVSTIPNKDKQLTLELSVAMATVSYVGRTSEAWLLGVGAGVGGAMGTMVVAGRHFSEANGWAYTNQDGFTDKDLLDILHAKFFLRYESSERWYVDSGLYGSLFLHWDSSDDDPGGGVFLGGLVNPMFGWRSIKFGPRVLVGYFSEGGGTDEFGVFLAPLIGSVTFRW